MKSRIKKFIKKYKYKKYDKIFIIKPYKFNMSHKKLNIKFNNKT